MEIGGINSLSLVAAKILQGNSIGPLDSQRPPFLDVIIPRSMW